MNVIFISDDPREADLLKHELATQAPAIRLETSPGTREVMARLAAGAACDAILVDASVSTEDASNMVATIRQGKKPIGIVALVGTTDKTPPLDLFKAGVDNFVLKRSGFVSLLQNALRQARDRHQANPAPQARPVRLLYAGDVEYIRKHLSGQAQFVIETVAFGPDGLLKLPETGTLQDEVLVVDGAAAGDHVLKAVRDAGIRVPDLPLILLTPPGDEETAIQAMRAGAADCIAKTESCGQRLIPTIGREIKRRELMRVRAALRSREERLRQIVETMPVGITVIATDGTFLAINRVGLKLMGAARLEQIIGKNLLQLLPQDEREKATHFLATVGKGSGASVHIDWKGLDGTISGMEFRAVPMRRDAAGTTAALAAIYPPGETPPQGLLPEPDRKTEDLARALGESEARLKELQEKIRVQQTEWEELLRQAETRRAGAEQQQSALKSAADEAEKRYKALLDTQAGERSAWEQTRQELEDQCAKIEGMAEQLRSSQQEILETREAEKSQWESRLQEWERKNAEAAEQLARTSETLAGERAQWETARRELEQRARDAEASHLSVKSALGDAETQLTQQAAGLTEEQSQWNAARQELERRVQDSESRRSLMESALRDVEARLAQLAEAHAAERSREDSLRAELERGVQAAEARRSELEQALARLAGEHQSEQARWDTERTELEQAVRESGAARASLEAALRDAEIRIADIAAHRTAEESEADKAWKELEEKVRLAESRASELEQALRKAGEDLAQAGTERDAAHSELDAVHRRLEQIERDSESRRIDLESALREAEIRLAQQAGTHEEERSRWAALQSELERKTQSLESGRAALEEALHKAEEELAQKSEALAAECARGDAVRQELQEKAQYLESQRISVESLLRDSEARLAHQMEIQNQERSQWDAIWLELEQKAQSAEALRSKLESAMRDAEERIVVLNESQNAERAQWEAARQDLEQKARETEDRRAAIEASLHEAEARVAELAESQTAERAQWEAARQDLEQKARETEDRRAAIEASLHEAEARVAELAESQTAERARWEAARQGLELQYQESETQRHSIQIAMEEVESYFSQQTEEHAAERSSWNLVRLEFEQKSLAQEEQRISLQKELQDATAALGNTAAAHASEAAQWNTLRQELEQKCGVLEQERAEARTALADLEARYEAGHRENREQAVLLEQKLKEIGQFETDLRQLRAESENLRLRHADLSQFSSAGVVLATLEGEVLQYNEAAAHMFGFPAEDEAGSGAAAFNLYAFDGALRNRLQQDGAIRGIEWSFQTPEGRLVRLREDARLVSVASREQACVERILKDITRTHPLSPEVRRSRRLESTVDLASATIRSLQDLCASFAESLGSFKEAPADGAQVCRTADTLALEADRGIRHARQYFAAAQKADRAFDLLNINRILTENMDLLRSLAGEDIEIQTVLSPRTGLVSANGQEMVQLISSLMTSAREMLPMGGTVTIETLNADLEDSAPGQTPAVHPGIYVVMRVAADGCTVQPERRIGSIQTIVEKMGGRLETAGDTRSGNVYRIALPRVEVIA